MRMATIWSWAVGIVWAIPRMSIDQEFLCPVCSWSCPSVSPFFTDVAVYVGHINIARHVDNALMLSLVAEARSRYFASLGYDEDAVEGLATTITDVLWLYKAEAFHGDVLSVEMVADDYNKYGFDLLYRMTRKSDGREIGRGKHGIVFIDLQQRKVARVPPQFRVKADALGN